jgi:hypothetical protein
MIRVGVSSFATLVTVVVGPASNDGVQFHHQRSCCSGLVGSDDVSDLCQVGFHIFLSGFDNELAIVLAYILTQEVKPFGNVRDTGLLWR